MAIKERGRESCELLPGRIDGSFWLEKSIIHDIARTTSAAKLRLPRVSAVDTGAVADILLVPQYSKDKQENTSHHIPMGSGRVYDGASTCVGGRALFHCVASSIF